MERIRGEVSRFLDFDAGESSALIVSNLDWTGPMHVLDFLRDIGKHFSVNRMLDRESVKARLEAGGISYTEFSYQLLQAMDFLRAVPPVRLHAADRRQRPVGQPGRRRRADQVGGGRVRARPGHPADHQAGRDQVRQDRGRRDLAERRPDVAVRVLPVLAERGRRRGAEPAPRVQLQVAGGDRGAGARERRAARRPDGQRALAEELTTLVHGAEETQRAIAASRALFGQGSLDRPRRAHPGRGRRRAAPYQLPTRPSGGTPELPPVANLMAAAGIVPTVSAARRAIAEGGAYLNNHKVTDVGAVPAADDLLHGRYLILRRGKRTVGAVEVIPEDK